MTNTETYTFTINGSGDWLRQFSEQFWNYDKANYCRPVIAIMHSKTYYDFVPKLFGTPHFIHPADKDGKIYFEGVLLVPTYIMEIGTVNLYGDVNKI